MTTQLSSVASISHVIVLDSSPICYSFLIVSFRYAINQLPFDGMSKIFCTCTCSSSPSPLLLSSASAPYLLLNSLVSSSLNTTIHFLSYSTTMLYIFASTGFTLVARPFRPTINFTASRTFTIDIII